VPFEKLSLQIQFFALNTMSFTKSDNSSEDDIFTPSFVSVALSGVTHRFILVLECESRQYEGEVAVSHPRFCVGGPCATLDPRNVSITDLLPLNASKVDLPAGWEKVHQLLYGMSANFLIFITLGNRSKPTSTFYNLF
jgi:hypothetical protein